MSMPPMKTIKPKNEFDRPTLRLSAKDLPAVKEWKVGEKYYLMIEVEQTQTGKEKYGPSKGSIYANFDIKKVSEYKSDKKDKK